MMKTRNILPLLGCLLVGSLFAQSNAFRPVEIRVADLTNQLQAAPDIFEKNKVQNAPFVKLPLPDGSSKTFQMFKTQPMHPDLAAKYPDILAYHGKCLDDGISAVAITISPAGLHAMLLDDKFQTSFIEPDNTADTEQSASDSYVSYYDGFAEYECHHAEVSSPLFPSQSLPKETQPVAQAEMMANNPLALGDKLRTHRMVMSATGEFTQANGGSAATVLPIMVSIVNQINLLYIREFAINFQLVANTDLMIFTNPATDPYVNDGDWDPDLQNNQTATDNIIGSANYDIAHLLQNPTSCPGCGGWAGWGPCNANDKARGMSVNSFAVIRHEMGHQFFCPHTTDPPFPDRYEHGAIGNTIMGGNHPDNVFHIYSANRVATWVEAPGYCVPGTNTNNSIPMVTVGTGGMAIPKSTPFQLSGSATDPDPNTTLLYNWQQFDNEINYTVVNNRIIPAGNTPVFKNFNPSTAGNVRTIPRLEDLVNNARPFGLSGSDTLDWETLPSYSRSLTFRLVARDYEMTGGAYDYGELTFSVDGNSGPFVVTSPNTGNPTWTTGNNVTVNWNVANTNIAPVSCANVDIKLSIDGGYTYPYILAANTPNDGSQTFLLSNGIPTTTSARVRVECASFTNVVFFDISNQNFTINSACVANAGLIVPVVDVTEAAGSPQLDLTLAPLYGLVAVTTNFSVVPSDPIGRFALLAVDQVSCVDGCCDLHFSTMDFQVDKAGTYSFTVNFNGTQGWFSLYNGSYNPATPCANFITATRYEAGGGGVGLLDPISATLMPGVTYRMVFHPWFTDNATGTVGFSSSSGGNVVFLNQGQPAPPMSDYGYTYVAVNTATGLIAAVSATANFMALPGGTYRVFGLSYKSANPPPAVVNPATLVGLSIEGALSSNQCIHFSSNFVNVVVTGGCTAPTVNAPTLTQPTCTVATGTIVVDASGNGALEYSVNGGANWQSSATFSNLSPGNYNIRVREQSNPACVTIYANNPVVLNIPATIFMSADVPKAISASGMPIVTSTLNIPASGTINDLNVVGLDIDHTWINDLRVKLKSPANTERFLLNQICGDQDDILIHFDDESANTYASIPCPPNGVTHQPNQSLSAFDGENLNGVWTLTVEDMANQDGGTLQAWGLEVCYSTCPTTLPVNDNPIVSGTYEAQQVITSSGTVANGGNVLFKAGTSIELLPNFEILLGGIFEVMMQGCVP